MRLPDIDLPTARRLLKAALETQGPDFVYNLGSESEPCFYVPVDFFGPNSPKAITGCIIGVALGLHGVTEIELSDLKRESIIFASTKLLNLGVVIIEGKAASYFSVAQVSQDGGSTWGVAYKKAEVQTPPNCGVGK